MRLRRRVYISGWVFFLQPRLPQTSSSVAGTFSSLKMYHKLYQYEIQLCTLEWYIFCTEQNQVQIKVNFWYNYIPKFGTFYSTGKKWYKIRYKIYTHFVPQIVPKMYTVISCPFCCTQQKHCIYAAF